MSGGEKGENPDSIDDKDERSADLHSPNWKRPPLFSVPVAGSSGSPAGNTRSGAMARIATSEKEQKERKK
jgi:hypothetical protein